MLNYYTFTPDSRCSFQYEYLWNTSKKKATHVGIEIEIDGYSGGSCWGDESSHYSTGNVIDKDSLIKSLENLNLIDLEKMSLKSYFNLKELIFIEDKIDREYYGNYTQYKVMLIELSKLEDL